MNFAAFGCEAYASFVLNLGWPYNSPLLHEPPAPDLWNLAPRFAHLHTPGFFSPQFPIPYGYPAVVAPLYGFFLDHPWTPRHITMFFEETLLFLMLLSASVFGLKLHRKGLRASSSLLVAVGAAVLSYPAWFELKQGNMEIFVCLLVGLGIWCFLREHLHAAAVFIGIAVAMKIFPFVYLGLYIARKRYLPLVTALLSAIAVTLASLRYMTPSIPASWRGIQQGLELYQQQVPLSFRREIGYDHSCFALVKRIIHFKLHAGFDVAPVLHRYMLAAALIGITLFFTRIRKLPIANQVLTLCVASIFFPPVSYDYTLLHLYIPWAMLVFLALQQGKRKTPGLVAAFVCLALATSSETEFIYLMQSFGGQVKAIVLLVLFIVALRFPFNPPEHTESRGDTALAL